MAPIFRGISNGVTGWATAGVLSVFLAVLAAGSVLAQSSPPALGALFPLSGGLQSYGEAAVRGVNIAVTEVNEGGGIIGQSVILKIGDSQTTPQGALEAGNRLVNLDNVLGLVGPMASSVALPVALSVAKPSQVAVISPSATAPNLTQANDSDFLFRTAPSDSAQGKVLADVVWRQRIDNVALIYQNDDYGVGLYLAFEEAFTALGGAVTALGFDPDSPSYRSELRKLSRSGARHLMVIAFPDNGGITIMRQSLEDSYFREFILTDGMKSQALLNNFDSQVLANVFGTSPRSLQGEARQKFEDAYRRNYGEQPQQPYIDTSYDAAMILMLAAESAQSTDPLAVRDHIRLVTQSAPGATPIGPGDFAKAREILSTGGRINYEGASGSVDFDSHGDVQGTYELWNIDTVTMQLNTVRLIYPK